MTTYVYPKLPDSFIKKIPDIRPPMLSAKWSYSNWDPVEEFEKEKEALAEVLEGGGRPEFVSLIDHLHGRVPIVRLRELGELFASFSTFFPILSFVYAFLCPSLREELAIASTLPVEGIEGCAFPFELAVKANLVQYVMITSSQAVDIASHTRSTAIARCLSFTGFPMFDMAGYIPMTDAWAVDATLNWVPVAMYYLRASASILKVSPSHLTSASGVLGFSTAPLESAPDYCYIRESTLRLAQFLVQKGLTLPAELLQACRLRPKDELCQSILLLNESVEPSRYLKNPSWFYECAVLAGNFSCAAEVLELGRRLTVEGVPAHVRLLAQHLSAETEEYLNSLDISIPDAFRQAAKFQLHLSAASMHYILTTGLMEEQELIQALENHPQKESLLASVGISVGGIDCLPDSAFVSRYSYTGGVDFSRRLRTIKMRAWSIIDIMRTANLDDSDMVLYTSKLVEKAGQLCLPDGKAPDIRELRQWKCILPLLQAAVEKYIGSNSNSNRVVEGAKQLFSGIWTEKSLF